jgi:hypothetical protein
VKLTELQKTWLLHRILENGAANIRRELSNVEINFDDTLNIKWTTEITAQAIRDHNGELELAVTGNPNDAHTQQLLTARLRECSRITFRPVDPSAGTSPD